MQKINFGEAIAALKAGKKVKRLEWDDFLVIGEPEDYPFPVIFIDVEHLGKRDYVPSSDDLLAEDWVIVKDPPLSFEEALEAVRAGKTVARWLGDTGQFPRFMHPDDVLATDWEIIDLKLAL